MIGPGAGAPEQAGGGGGVNRYNLRFPGQVLLELLAVTVEVVCADVVIE